MTIIACLVSRGDTVIVLCCHCGQRPAVHASQSGESWYCDECCVSRCGKHSIEDYVYDEDLERWVDPCVARRSKAEQRELWEIKK